MVVYDVQCGLVSERSAHDDFGVVLRKVGRKWEADVAASEERRAALANKRLPLPMFDRGPYFEQMKRQGAVKRPENWPDPDAGWLAVG
jgi:hypothetical protein